jgi:hypothetical protein
MYDIITLALNNGDNKLFVNTLLFTTAICKEIHKARRQHCNEQSFVFTITYCITMCMRYCPQSTHVFRLKRAVLGLRVKGLIIQWINSSLHSKCECTLSSPDRRKTQSWLSHKSNIGYSDTILTPLVASNLKLMFCFMETTCEPLHLHTDKV